MGRNLRTIQAGFVALFMISVMMGLAGCFRLIEAPGNVVELEPGKPEWEPDAAERVAGRWVARGALLNPPVSYDTYRGMQTDHDGKYSLNFLPKDVIDGILWAIKSRAGSELKLFEIARKEGMSCNEKTCFRHYCTWQAFRSKGILVKETPAYCLDVTITPSSCFPQSDNCVLVSNFKITE